MTRMSDWSAAVWLMTALGCTLFQADASFSAASGLNSQATRISAAQDESMRHNDAGGRLFQQGNLEGAAHEFREAIRLNPQNPILHNNFGMVFHVQGQPTKALVEFREAVTLNPGYAPAWSNLGFALFELAQTASAVEAWRIAMRLNQQLAGTWAGLALGQFVSGYVDSAIESYRQAIHLDPHYADLAYLQTVRHWSVRALTQADRILRAITARQQVSLLAALV